MYIKASHIACGKITAEDFAALKAGIILGLEDDKFRRCGTVWGICPSRPPSAAGKAHHPLKYGKCVVKCDRIQNENHVASKMLKLKHHPFAEKTKYPCGGFSLLLGGASRASGCPPSAFPRP